MQTIMKRSFVSFLFMAFIAMGNMYAYDFKSGDVYYTITSSTEPYTVEVARGNYSTLSSIIIPSSVTYNGTTYGVTSIGDSVFYVRYSLHAITLPESVTNIGNSAFNGCEALTSITIPESVTSIGDKAFYDCKSLTSMTIPESVNSIGEYAFSECNSLTSISIPDNITSIERGTFENCRGLKSITIPNNVTSIGEYAFYGCVGLTSITIPENVTNIEQNAFYDCDGLTSVTWNAKNCNGWEGYSPFYDAYTDAEKITSFTFGNTVVSIPAHLCYHMQNLTSIIIPNSVTSIGEGAFLECTGLASITIPNSVTSIGASAFSQCSNLTSITIPNSITRIENHVFEDCATLADINLPNTITSIGTYAFCRCTNLKSILIPNSVTSIEDGAFMESGLTSISIPNNVTYVGVNAFYACSALASASIGESVTSTVSAFLGCYNLTSITWNAKNCNEAPFSGIASQITSFTFGDKVEIIPERLCFSMSKLTTVTIPNSVLTIGASAFGSCTNLTSVTIGNSVTTIGDFAFSGCSKITSIKSDALTPPTCGNVVFALVDTSIPVYIPCGALVDYQTATNWNNFSNLQEPPAMFSIKVHVTDMSMGTAQVEQFATCSDNTTIISATANERYHFSQWSDGNTDNPRTIVLTHDTIIYAQFTSSCVITTNCDPAQGNITGGGTYDEGTTITLTATPLDDYRFAQWSDGSTENPRVVIVNGDATYTALFEQVSHYYTIVADCEPAQGVVTGGGTFQEGTTVTLTATPNDGYRFGQWSDGNTDNPRTVTVTEDKTYTAEFIKLCIITADCDAAQGTVTGDGTYDEGTTVTLTATPNDGYRFGQWSDGNTDNPRTVTATEDKTYTAEFVKLCIITVDCDAAQGIVTGSGTYDEGKTITLTATPNDGYRFGQWNDGNTDNPRAVTATEDKNYTAEFVKLCIITADCDAAQGTVTGGGTYDEGTTVTLTATPNKGYVFARWDDNNTDNPRSVVVLADAAYTAFFDEEQTALDQVGADGTAAQKIIRNGQVLIQRGDKLYTLTGQEIIKH